MPTARATSTSSLESSVKVTRPSTSSGSIPASSIARLTASQASASSETPEALLYLVCPIPTMAASSLSVVGKRAPASEGGAEDRQLEAVRVLVDPGRERHADAHRLALAVDELREHPLALL